MAKAYRMVDGRVKLVEVDGCERCGNTSGRFRIIKDKKYCAGKCCPADKSRDTAKNPWEFESMHISDNPNAGPVKVQSLSHLRRLEREHGVVSVVANYDERNW